MTRIRWRPALVAAAALAAIVITVPGDAQGAKNQAGVITAASAHSAALGGDINYNVYLPYGYETSTQRYPVLYLLHGRGDGMAAWTQVKGQLDEMIQQKTMPPVIAIMPDAPWSERGSWYVDSEYTGVDIPGEPVETALTRDLVQAVDATYRTAAIRNARLIGGYSMGGAGALRFALAHQDLFGSALILSPAVYSPLPPSDSDSRNYGAFGVGDNKFDDDIYQQLSYPALLPSVNPDLPLHLFIAVGDDEYANPDPADAHHDLDFESEALYNTVRRVPGITADMRILDGGHDWDVWGPAFAQGMAKLGPLLSTVPPTGLPAPVYGTPGSDWAGGAAPGPDGTTFVGYAASGPLGGQPYAGGLDGVVSRLGSDGKPQWTHEFGTSGDERLYGVVPEPDGGVLTAGYTHGNLDGHHAGNATDDAFVARLDASGTLEWLTQFGVAGAADRAYGIAAAPDGGAYLAGYTKGALDGANAGDKDAVVARITPDGQVAWARQLGGTGEDKAFGVAADASGAFVVGSTPAGLPGARPLGGSDGWIARYTADGVKQWVSTVGGPDDDTLTAVTVNAAGLAVATGESNGDVMTVAYSAAGKQKWTNTVSTPAEDAGAAITPVAGGGVEVIGYTGGQVGVPAGGADILAIQLSAKGKQVGAAQFGSARDDGVDPFDEPNLFAAPGASSKVLVTGVTYGSPTGVGAPGNGDVFVASVDPTTGLP
jgi:enterochelin esterase-like enzyme